MERLEWILSTLEQMLNTKQKRHIAGGVLVSAALLFGGLTVTVVTLKDETHEIEHFEKGY